MFSGLIPRFTKDAKVLQTGSATWRLEIPAGTARGYRLAQLDDYQKQSRHAYPRRSPFTLILRARASQRNIPGTWGMGLWNNPFGMALFSGSEGILLPVIPNAAWFFFASQENYLSLRDDIPAWGALAATFRSPHWSALWLAPGALAAPLLLIHPLARLLRRLSRKVIQQDALQLALDPTEWHTYRLDWQAGRVLFWVDDGLTFETSVVPHAPLGCVIWIDNQFASFRADGNLRFGSLANPESAWIEIEDLQLEGG